MSEITSERNVSLNINAPLATITFRNARHRNAMTMDMWLKLPSLITQAEQDSGVRVVLLRGAGEVAFVSGADISEFTNLRARGAPARAYDKANSNAFAAIRNCSKPSVAMIHGACMGGGFGMAAACDLRYASDTANFAIPAAKLGIGYPVDAMQDIVSAVGSATAKELFYTAKVINAQEAFRLGFLNQIFTTDDLEKSVLALLEQIARGAPLTLLAAKLAIAAVEQHSDKATQAAHTAAEICFDSADYEEGVKAFLNKRSAEFKGN